jgi:hypothetical protein
VSNNSKDIVEYKDDKCIIKADNDNTDVINIIKEEVFNNLKIDNIGSFISEINKGDIYRFKYTPENGYLFEYPDGSVSGVWRNKDTGRILEHGRLEKIGQNIGNICKIAANQIMLACIIMQLDEINNKIDIILESLNNDRIGLISGGIVAFESFDTSTNSNINNYMNIVLQIATGIEQLVIELNRLSDKLNPKANRKENWFKDNKNKENKKNHDYFTKSIFWIFKGYETLLKIDMLTGKHTNAEKFIEFLETFKWEELTELARGLPYEKSEYGYPEERWENINTKKPMLVNDIRRMIDSDKENINEYVIEFKGETLLEVLK